MEKPTAKQLTALSRRAARLRATFAVSLRRLEEYRAAEDALHAALTWAPGR